MNTSRFDLSTSTYAAKDLDFCFSGEALKNMFEGKNLGRKLENILPRLDDGSVQRTAFIPVKLNENHGRAMWTMMQSSAPREEFPGFAKFLNGETVFVSNNKLHVYASALNVSNIQNFVQCVVRLLKPSETFMNVSVYSCIVESSVAISNFQTFPGGTQYTPRNRNSVNYWMLYRLINYDTYEMLATKYEFDITFTVALKMREPLSQKHCLEKYEAGVSSECVCEILQDIMANPGRFEFSDDEEKVWLIPSTFEEAEACFRKRVIQGSPCKMSAFVNTLMNSTDNEQVRAGLNIFKLLKQGVYSVTRKRKRLFYLSLNAAVNSKDFSTNLFSMEFALDDLLAVLRQVVRMNSKPGNWSEMLEKLGGMSMLSFGNGNALYVDFVNLLNSDDFAENVQNAAVLKLLLQDLKLGLETVRRVVDNSQDMNNQIVADTMYNAVVMDPFSYVNDGNLVVSSFAKACVNGGF